MKSVEFESTVAQNGQISIPPAVAAELAAGQPLRVVVMWEPCRSDAAWREAGAKSFEVAYSPEDSVYEQLIDAPAIR